MGAAVGFISGLFGIGGGFLMTPLLIFLGIPPAVAVATQSAQIVASSTTSVLGAHPPQRPRPQARRHPGRRRLRRLGARRLVLRRRPPGRPARSRHRRLLRDAVHRRRQPDAEGEHPGVLAPGARAAPCACGGSAGEHAPYLGWPLRMRFYRSKLYVSVIPILALSLFIGFAGALLGIGGGFIVVPALLYVFRVPTTVVVGTSQFQIVCTTLVALILHAVANQAVDMVLAILLIVGGVFGAQFGARMGRNLRAELFRFLLAILLLAVGLRFALELVLKPAEPFSITVQEVRTVRALGLLAAAAVRPGPGPGRDA